jgi:hypothetical protein
MQWYASTPWIERPWECPRLFIVIHQRCLLTAAIILIPLFDEHCEELENSAGVHPVFEYFGHLELQLITQHWFTQVE